MKLFRRIEFFSTWQHHSSPVFILPDSQWWLVSSSVDSTWNQYNSRADVAEQEPDKDQWVCNEIRTSRRYRVSKITALTQGCDLTTSAHIGTVCNRYESEQVFQGLWSSNRFKDVMFNMWMELTPPFLLQTWNKKRQKRELKLKRNLLMHHNLNSPCPLKIL